MKNVSSGIETKKTKNYFVILGILWTIAIVISACWNIYDTHKETIVRAEIQAKELYKQSLIFRRLISNLGGVYVSKDKVATNPYLKVPDRDVETKDGKYLTLINPAYFTRMVFELQRQESSVVSHLTSLKFLNPANEPDEWERHALIKFEQGVKSISQVIEYNGKSYYRLINPFFVEESCLKCHGDQGYKVGDIRGAISVAVPMISYLAAEKIQITTIVFSHILLLLTGLTIILFFSKRISKKESDLEESESKFKIVANSAITCEYWSSEDKDILHISPSCEILTGYKCSDFITDKNLVDEIVHPEDKQFYEQHLNGDFTAPEHKEITFRIISKYGDIRHISHICAPIFINGVFKGRRISNIDITEKKKLEEQLFQSQKMEAIGILAGGVAHDFNNILQAIIGYGDILRTKLKGDEKLYFYIDNIMKSCERAVKLTRGLLSFSRKQLINPKPQDLNEIISDLELFLRRIIGEDIDFKIVYKSEKLIVNIDRSQFEQLIMNLVTNARDAMPNGGLLVIETKKETIDLEKMKAYELGSQGDFCVLCVSDNGIGMDEKTRQNIFEPFFTTKEVGKGTGLGLAMVFGIIKQHKGHITCYSEPGQGTTFKIYLPLVSENTDKEEVKAEKILPCGKETILIAEDDEALGNLSKEILETAGYNVILAKDGEDACKKFLCYKYDINLVILDVIMPRKNGKQALDEMKMINPKIKSLFFSGYTKDIIEKVGVLEDDISFVSKPVTSETLLTKVRETLDK